MLKTGRSSTQKDVEMANDYQMQQINGDQIGTGQKPLLELYVKVNRLELYTSIN